MEQTCSICMSPRLPNLGAGSRLALTEVEASSGQGCLGCKVLVEVLHHYYPDLEKDEYMACFFRPQYRIHPPVRHLYPCIELSRDPGRLQMVSAGQSHSNYFRYSKPLVGPWRGSVHFRGHWISSSFVTRSDMAQSLFEPAQCLCKYNTQRTPDQGVAN